jgi:hypothetical protein
MLAVVGTPNAPLNISVIGGTFYNSPFNGDQAPNNAFFVHLPSIAFETFVTIGKKTAAGDTLTIMPGFPTGITGSSLSTTTSGWSVIPTAPQGDPFDASNSFPGNGHILIGQFTTLDGSAIQGTMLLQFISNGVADEAVVSFLHAVPGPGCLPALALGALTARRRRIGRPS